MAYNRPNKKELEGVFDEVKAIQEVIPHMSTSEILNFTWTSKKLLRMTGEPDPASYGYSIEQYEKDIVRRPLVRSKLLWGAFLFPIITCLLAAFLGPLSSQISSSLSPNPIDWALVGMALGGIFAQVFYCLTWSRKEKYDFANYHRHELELISYVRSSRRRL